MPPTREASANKDKENIERHRRSSRSGTGDSKYYGDDSGGESMFEMLVDEDLDDTASRKKNSKKGRDSDESTGRRSSSRSTKFTSSLKEPNGNSIADLLKDTLPVHKKKKSQDDVVQAESSKKGRDSDEGINRRSSSRSNKFIGSMKDPTIADVLLSIPREVPKPREAPKQKAPEKSSTSTKKPSTSKRSSKKSKSDSSDDESDSEDDNDLPAQTKKTRKGSSLNQKAGTQSRLHAPKSPAKRHSSRRHRMRTEIPVSEDEDDSSEEEDDSGDESGSEEEEIKIQKVIASRSEPRRFWRETGKTMNTSEIENGSRWFQTEAEEDTDRGDETFEERFLVKWMDLGFLHCSWELESDILSQVEGSKAYLRTFFRKSVNGLLFDADERLDGDYFDPSFVQVERILEVIDPEPLDNDVISNGKGRKREIVEEGNEKSSLAVKYGIIFDKDDPNYESGTGRQFLVKWKNTPYKDTTYEFERDLILNEVEYEGELQTFILRSKKPTKSEMKQAEKVREEQTRRLYKTFGDAIKTSEEETAKKIKVYQEKVGSEIFKNGGQLRDYQAEGVTWLMANHINKRCSILADEMGLGKTIQTAVYVDTVAKQLKTRGPFLIVAPLSTIPHWYREFTGWTSLNTIVYHGSGSNREYTRELEFAFERDRPHEIGFNQSFTRKCHSKTSPKWQKTWMVQVVITTPEMLVTDDFAELAHIEWEILVVDEAHRLKNHASKLTSNLRSDQFRFNHTLLLTGTPIQNNMSELWTLLNFIDPDKFENVDSFLERYGNINSKDRVDELHEIIRPYILRRLKEDVEKSVPPKEETLIEVELTLLQKQYYRALYEKNVQFLHRNHKKALDGPSISNLAMQLRKCCNHPFLLRGVEEELREKDRKSEAPVASEADFLANASGKLVLLDKLLPRLKQDGHRVLIFSQFKIMLDVLEDFLHARAMKYERIDGSITGNKRQMAIDRFQADTVETKETSFVMLLSTRAGGVGINLTAADTVILYDSDWNPQSDLQAQARCHRIGQTKNVKVYRLLTRKTYEMQMFHMSSLKMGLDQAVLQGFESGGGDSEQGGMTKEEVERLLRHGAYDIFNEEKVGSSEAESKDFIEQDIDSILARRSRVVVHENTGSKSTAAGGTFSKASFKAAKNQSGNQNSADTEEVDIDDPDFWKKMVGEAKAETQNDLAGKKRKRKQANYSEMEYEKDFHASIRSDGFIKDVEDLAYNSDSNSNNSDDDVDSESQTQTPEDKNCERSHWGGKGPLHWEKADVEKLISFLVTYGYNNIATQLMLKKLDFESDEYDQEEVERMTWALVFCALYEAAEDEVTDKARRVERAAIKKRESEEGTRLEDGGVLGTASKNAEQLTDGNKNKNEEETCPSQGVEGDRSNLEMAFESVWKTNSSWAVKAVTVAISFANSHPPRSEGAIHSLLHGSNGLELKTQISPIVIAFNQNILPSLRSRGWKEEVIQIQEGKRGKPEIKSTRYTHGTETYGSVSAVLAAVPTVHPELANTVQTILESAAAENNDNNDVDDVNGVTKPEISLDITNMTAQSIRNFLDQYGPLQLLSNRRKTTKICIPRKLNNVLSLLHVAHELVTETRKEPDQISDTEEIVRLTNHISKHKVDKRIVLPHPNWLPVHDAILIRAIAKHGWIDRESCCRAITEDVSIRWGPPFGILNEKEVKLAQFYPKIEHQAKSVHEDEIKQVIDSASRASSFFTSNDSILNNWKTFNMNHVVNNLALYKPWEDDDSESVAQLRNIWSVNEEKLKSTMAHNPEQRELEEQSELPTRKDLLKRAKTILSRSSRSTSKVEASEPEATKVISPTASHDYCVLAEDNRNNIFLRELIRSVISCTTKQGPKEPRLYLSCAIKESKSLRDAYKKNAEKTDSSYDWASKVRDMTKVCHQLLFVSRHMKKSTARQGKNVLRVMIGIDPVAPKKPGETLFLQDRSQEFVIEKRPTKKTSVSSSPLSQNTKEIDNNVSASGDAAINRALSVGLNGGVVTEFARDFPGIQLTSVETLLLSVICSQGLPVWIEDWKSLICESDARVQEGLPGHEYTITWWGMGAVVETAAQVWYKIASNKLKAKRDSLQMKYIHLNLSESDMLQKSESYRNLRRDVTMKKQATGEAKACNAKPLDLAKKCIMLLNALQMRMGGIEIFHGGKLAKAAKMRKRENRLGPWILDWGGKELARWAQSLEIVDGQRQPLAFTGADYLVGSPNELTCVPAATLNYKACRAVFGQIAQQTRLRSIFLARDAPAIPSLIQSAEKNPGSLDDVWKTRPTWWGVGKKALQYDTDLLIGILDYGYSGFGQMLKNTESFCGVCEDVDHPDKMVNPTTGKSISKGSAQKRINQLTRELHAIDAADVMRVLESSKVSESFSENQAIAGRGVQTSLDLFVSSKKHDDSSVEVIEDDSSVEVIDVVRTPQLTDTSPSGSSPGKREAYDNDQLTTEYASAEKKQKI
eukprot:CAMPEP_0198281478 /NCGR_PEP_ID=MMETSP1449-20131203/1401_1 /TAXON_ID=420275 /ORGANISM="Attheya septentrionalis, Strain CCMP2084" /LENGTH=2448 /DNA_ID=CAMNT_0043977257 /DNA_START=144 /DNA_END=7490 /DNA_ORIENTATION=+